MKWAYEALWFIAAMAAVWSVAIPLWLACWIDYRLWLWKRYPGQYPKNSRFVAFLKNMILPHYWSKQP